MRIGLDLPINDAPDRFARIVRAVERGGYCSIERSKRAALAACRRGVGLLLGRYPRYGELAGVPAPVLERLAREIREAPERPSPSTPDEIVDEVALAGPAGEVARRLEELATRRPYAIDLYLLSADQLGAIRGLARALPRAVGPLETA
jgi:hypothetical protein